MMSLKTSTATDTHRAYKPSPFPTSSLAFHIISIPRDAIPERGSLYAIAIPPVRSYAVHPSVTLMICVKTKALLPPGIDRPFISVFCNQASTRKCEESP